jgi:hypothetical protein
MEMPIVKHCYSHCERMETITVNVTIWTMFLEGVLLHSSVSPPYCKRHFAYALIFNELSSVPGSTVPVLSNAWT